MGREVKEVMPSIQRVAKKDKVYYYYRLNISEQVSRREPYIVYKKNTEDGDTILLTVPKRLWEDKRKLRCVVGRVLEDLMMGWDEEEE